MTETQVNDKTRRHDNETANKTNKNGDDQNERPTEFKLITQILKLSNNKSESTSHVRQGDVCHIKCEPDLDSLNQTLSCEAPTDDQQMTPMTGLGPQRFGFECHHCNVVFAQSERLDKHLAEEHNSQDLNTDKESPLVEHKEIGLKAKSFQCNRKGCDKWFASLNRLNLHRSSHFSETRFKCPNDNCGQWFKTEDELQEHKQVKHRIRNNFLGHSGDRPFNCPGCNKAFRYDGSLKSHKCPKASTHISQSNQKSCSANSHMTDKQFILEDDVPFECELCSEIVKSESELLIHKRHIHQIHRVVSTDSRHTSHLNNVKPSTSNTSFSYYTDSLFKRISSSNITDSFSKPYKRKNLKQKANNPPSSYALFVKDFTKAQSVDKKIEFKTLSKTCAQIWKKMPDNEKEKYNRTAAEIRINMLKTGGRAQRVHKKETKKERKRTNYWNFADSLRAIVYNEMKQRLSEEGRTPNMKDVNKELGTRWHKLSDQQKESYRSKDSNNIDKIADQTLMIVIEDDTQFQ